MRGIVVIRSTPQLSANYEIQSVFRKLKEIVDIVDPAYLVLWGREGPMKHDVAMRCIDLLAQEVIPAIKEYVPERYR